MQTPAISQDKFPQNQPVQPATLGTLLEGAGLAESARDGLPDALRAMPSVSGQTTTIEAAIRAICSRKWAVVRGEDKVPARKLEWGGGKNPQVELPNRTQKTDRALDWLGKYPAMCLGLSVGQFCQSPDGLYLLALDFDDMASWEVFQELCASHGFDVSLTYVEKTPRGIHCFFYASPSLNARNNNKIELIEGCHPDIKWAGGFVVVAPSVRSDGGRYEVLHDCRPADLPSWLATMINDFFATKDKAVQQQAQPDQQSNINANLTNVKPLASGKGTVASHDDIYRRRLAKFQQSALDGEFAKLVQEVEGGCNNQIDNSALSLSRVEGMEYQRAFDCLHKACEINGYIARDGEAAFRNTFNSGWNAGQKMPKRGPSPVFQRVGALPEGRTLPAPLPAGTPEDQIQWPELCRYDDDILDSLEDFDVSNHGFGLPAILRDVIVAHSEAFQISQGACLCAFFGAFAAACQGKWRLQIKPGYTVPLSLYIMAVLGPGNLKTPLVDAAKQPIKDFEFEVATRMSDKVAAVMTANNVSMEMAKKHERNAVKAKAAEERKHFEKMAAEERKNIKPVPVPPIYTLDDCTPESLVQAMQTNALGVSVIESEATFINVMMGQYSEGQANITSILKAHDSTEIKVQRVSREWLYIRNPNLTLMFLVQPVVLYRDDKKKNKKLRDLGFDARWFFAILKSKVGYRSGDSVPVPDHIKEKYHDKIMALLEYPESYDITGSMVQPYIIDLTPEAKEVWRDIWQEIETEQQPTGIFADSQDFASKLAGHIGRIAGILHAMEHDEPHSHPVTAATMQQAIQLGAFFSEHCQAAYKIMDRSEDTGSNGARAILSWIMDSQKKGGITREFTERNAWKILSKRPLFKDQKKIFDAGLEELCIRGYLVQIEGEKTKGRAKSFVYRLNPAVYSDKPTD